MNKQIIALKVKAICLWIIAIVVFVLIYSAFLIYNKNNYYPTANKGRLLTDSIRSNIESAIEKNIIVPDFKSKFPYTVIDLKGKILFSSISEYKKGETVNFRLRDIQIK